MPVGQEVGQAVPGDQQGREMTRVRPGQLPPAVVRAGQPGEDQGGHADVGDGRDRLVEPGDDPAGGILLGPCVGPQHVAQLRHSRGRLQIVADDVSDGQGRGGVGQGEGVVPVPAHLRGVGRRQIAHGHLQARHDRHLRQQVVLHGLGDLALTLVEAGVVEGQSGPAGDVLQQREVGGGEVPGCLGAAQGQCP
ncbi:hypothetical protein GCM10010510_24570 [Streptomyces anandii JCM 4720]|nr:hypothetical protein GCM10010510_24570 [Streptomyces anandii JCM 4720]